MPGLNIIVTVAMREAIKHFAKTQSALKGQRVSMSDVVVQALRNSGFEREDVLEAIERGEVPDIDVRTRTPAIRRDDTERVAGYLAERGCQPAAELSRHLHMAVTQLRRALLPLFEAKQCKLRPFDRPTIVHWSPTCKCATALPADLPRET
jgi:hypothetical protein